MQADGAVLGSLAVMVVVPLVLRLWVEVWIVGCDGSLVGPRPHRIVHCDDRLDTEGGEGGGGHKEWLVYTHIIYGVGATMYMYMYPVSCILTMISIVTQEVVSACMVCVYVFHSKCEVAADQA